MTNRGIVRQLVSDKEALVELIGKEKIEKMDCHTSSCESCETCGKKNKFLLADYSEIVFVGDVVEIYTETSKYNVAVFVTFILPLIMLFIGIALGKGNETKSLIWGLILFAFSLIFAYIFDKSFKAKVIVSKVIERND